MMFVAIMGPVANLLLCFVATFLLWAFVPPSGPSDVGYALLGVLKLNVLLMCFNLLPIPPLDGSKVVLAFFPWSMARWVLEREAYAMPVFFAVIILAPGTFRSLMFFMPDVFNFFNALSVPG
jgi:Zn-dependent protease